MAKTKEESRVYDSLDQKIPIWRKWGTFVSERQWGTVREDYSPDGNAWNYITHDMARSRAYRWGEDGIAGWCDQLQTLVFSLGLWNEKDPILKERLFGLAPTEGNHGEDVKEYFFYLDATPTHSYMKFLYKYPQEAFPYQWLLDENRKRGTHDREFELIDTGIFNDNRYFDVVVEYAKEAPEDVCIRIEIFNRADKDATIHVLPQLYFRNRWSWSPKETGVPEIREDVFSKEFMSVYADPTNLPPPDWISYDYQISPMYLYGDVASELLFTDNDTNNTLLYGATAQNRTPFVKDAFHRHVIQKLPCVNPAKTGTKACFHYSGITIAPKGSHVIKMRLTNTAMRNPLKDVEKVVELRKKEADAFYASIQSEKMKEEDRKIQRHAIAGMLWSSQFYHYDVTQWLDGDNPLTPPPASRHQMRNSHWQHFHSNQVICMPDKWEYPWFASWDCSFHSVVLALVDLPYAKEQLNTFMSHMFQHPNGQVPAYEWGFSDTNPPVQAWALWKLYDMERKKTDQADRDFLELGFLKLMQNFSWWVNKVDSKGFNIFEGGFLGLDNISIVDRSRPLPNGEYFEQSDATGWMAFFALLMMRIALELANTKPIFELIALVYFEHFCNISKAMRYTKARPFNLWDEEEGFYHDVICYADGSHQRLKVRSFVGLIPCYSLSYFDQDEIEKHKIFHKHFKLMIQRQQEMGAHAVIETQQDGKKGYLFSLMNLDQLKSVLRFAWNQEEFLSPYGLRSVSKFHEKNPFTFEGNTVIYEPGESLERIKGGNSNWRGPIWFPTNFLFVEALKRLEKGVGPSFAIEVNGQKVTLGEMIHSLNNRLIDLFRINNQGIHPVHGDYELFQKDPYWKGLPLFYEHYHGDTGRGLGASHQTGWSGLVANLIQLNLS